MATKKTTGKLVIPNIISNNNFDKNTAVKKWKTIESAIDQIYQQNASQLSFQTLYTAGYQIVLHKHGGVLYDGVNEVFLRYIKEFRDNLLQKSDDSFLPELISLWEKHRTAVTMIRDILMYMDKNFVPQNKKIGVYELGTQLFASELFKYSSVLQRFQGLSLGLIRRERDGEMAGGNARFLLKSLTTMMVELDKKEVYEKCFEQAFLADSEQYYKAEAALFFHASTVRDYLYKVQTRLKEERERAERCFDEDTKGKIENVIKTEMIEKYKTALIDKEKTGVINMLESWKLDDLRLIFEVLGLVPGALQPTIDKVRRFCTDNGVKIVNDPDKDKKPLELVEEILKMREKYEDMLIKSFSVTNNGNITKDKEFDLAVRRAFDDICNTNTRFPEYLSLYADSKLTRGKTQVLEGEYDTVFNSIINLFRHIREKDVFEKFYKTHLAKRLLTARSVSDDCETGFINKLKAEFGYQFTAKLEQMFSDMKLSKEYNENYRDFLKKKSIKLDVDLTISVLTLGSWPVNPSSSCLLPDNLNKALDTFKDFYLDRHSGRRIAWQYNMGNADIRLCPDFGKNYEVNVSTYQMAVLLLFNTNNSMTLQHIQVATGVPIAELKKNVFGLCSDSKTHQRLLTNSDGKSLNDNSEISLNHDFQSSKLKISITPVAVKESTTNYSETLDKINEDRKWQIDAVIVRVMKMRRTMEHRNLVLEVTNLLQSRFTPSPDLIKKRIESLIEREYLERVEGQRNKYNYLA